MRIFQLGKTWFSESAGGGSDRVFAALQKHLPGTGVQVHGVVFGSSPVNGSTVPGMHSVADESSTLATRWRAIRRHVCNTLPSFDADVVTSHFALYALPVLDVIRHHPYVVHFHGPWARESTMEGESALKAAIKSRVEKTVYRRGDRFIVLSPAFRDILVDQYGVSAGRVHIVPGGVDVAAYDCTHLSRTEARQRLGWPTDRPTLLSVRRLVKRVGLEGLVQAVDEIRRTVPDVLLMIAGKGPLRDDLEAMIADLDLQDHAWILGFVPEGDLPLAYRAATLSVMPTIALEGFGLSAVESLAAGTPVMVTPVGGLPTIVERLTPDLIFESADPGAMIPRLTAALTGTLALPSGTECRNYAAENFDWSVIAEQTQEVYRHAMQDH